MQQGALPFLCGTANRIGGATALSGMAVCLEMAESIRRHVRLRKEGQGWTFRKMIAALTLLNLVGREAVDDLRALEANEGLAGCWEGWRLTGGELLSAARSATGGGAVGACLTLVIYCLNMFGDAMRDLLDPRLRGTG